MFIGQGSSIIGVCVVYGLSSLVHPFYCLYKPLAGEMEKKKEEKRHTVSNTRDRELRY
jgi:hypothetical protein